MPKPLPCRIAVVTGTRAEYGLMQSMMRALQQEPRCELQVIATGMHLLPRFGRTVQQIEADGFPVMARVPMQRGDDSPGDQAEGLARGISGIAKVLLREQPRAVVVLGDRIEALAGGLAGRATGVRVAHLHGGDVAPGDFDGPMRDALTQLATWHFTASAAATTRVLRMGADRRCVWNVGAPGLDRLRELLVELPVRNAARGGARGDGTSKAVLEDDFALVVQHAYGRDAATEERVMRDVLSAVADVGLRRVIIAPNSDRGCAGVLRAIESHAAAATPQVVEVHASLPRDEFLRRLMNARVLIGNSSTAFIEAPFAGTPAVNVGERQTGREEGLPRTVLHATESARAIRAAMKKAQALKRSPGRKTAYGDGQAGTRIASRLVAVAARA